LDSLPGVSAYSARPLIILSNRSGVKVICESPPQNSNAAGQQALPSAGDGGLEVALQTRLYRARTVSNQKHLVIGCQQGTQYLFQQFADFAADILIVLKVAPGLTGSHAYGFREQGNNKWQGVAGYSMAMTKMI